MPRGLIQRPPAKNPALSVYFEISRRPGNWSADIAREDRIVGRQRAYETRNVLWMDQLA